MDEGRVEELLKRTLAVAEDNNRMLRAMRRNAFWGGVFKGLWWIVILGIPVLIYYFYLAPMIAQMQATYQNIERGAAQFQSLSENTENLPEPLRSIVQSFLKNQ